MKKSMKSTAAMLLAAILTLSLGVWAQAEGLTGAAALYESASSAVVGVYAMGETWSRESGASIAERDYGTGLYVDERGYVLTCWHLIQSADFVEIETASGERVRVSEILSDNTVDIAVLKLEAPLEGVQPLSLGGEARVGQRVYAIANAFDAFGVYPAQMTAGVVSGVRGDTERAANFSRSFDRLRRLRRRAAGRKRRSDRTCDASCRFQGRGERERVHLGDPRRDASKGHGRSDRIWRREAAAHGRDGRGQ